MANPKKVYILLNVSSAVGAKWTKLNFMEIMNFVS